MPPLHSLYYMYISLVGSRSRKPAIPLVLNPSTSCNSATIRWIEVMGCYHAGFEKWKPFLHLLMSPKAEDRTCTKRCSVQKNTAKLYGDALVWTIVFIDCLDLFELIYYTFELIGLTLFNWLIEWMDESNISSVQNFISHTWFKLVWLNISRLKVLLDNWF